MHLALDFPPISHLIEWPTIFGKDWYAVNKVVILMWLSVIIVAAFYFKARKGDLVPKGVQNGFARTRTGPGLGPGAWVGTGTGPGGGPVPPARFRSAIRR